MSDFYEKTDDEPSFALNDFKKWMSNEEEVNSNKCHLFGIRVESRINSKRLMDKIEIKEGDLTEVVKEFKKYGGIILDTDSDQNFLIEVDSGSFLIPKYLVKKSDH